MLKPKISERIELHEVLQSEWVTKDRQSSSLEIAKELNRAKFLESQEDNSELPKYQQFTPYTTAITFEKSQLDQILRLEQACEELCLKMEKKGQSIVIFGSKSLKIEGIIFNLAKVQVIEFTRLSGDYLDYMAIFRHFQ